MDHGVRHRPAAWMSQAHLGLQGIEHGPDREALTPLASPAGVERLEALEGREAEQRRDGQRLGARQLAGRPPCCS